MTFLDKEKSLTQSEPYELHAFWEGDYLFPHYPVLRTTTSQADPGLTHTIPISDVNDLQDMDLNRAGNYYLTNNIDASATSGWNGGAGFEPIGTSGSPFTGTLDGCGYTISGLVCNRNAYYQSLMGYVGETAKIANLTLTNVSITGGIYHNGALAGYVRCGDAGDVTIQNCHSSGTIQKHSSAAGTGYYGGLIGSVQRKIGDSGGKIYVYDSSSSCTVVGNGLYNYRGGLIGYGTNLTISNCYATGNITNPSGSPQDVGGLVGYLGIGCTVSYCYATGNIAGDATVGGLIGNIGQDNIISKCYATGNATGSDVSVGGFCGSLSSGTTGIASSIIDCYAWGNTEGNTDVGGFVGYAPQARDNFINCYSVGAVTGNTNVGGFDGDSNINTTFTSCYWDMNTSGQSTTDGDAIGKTTQQMYNKATYIGWDFNSIWAMSDLVEGDGLWLFADAPQDIEYNGYIYRACYISGDKIEQGTTNIKSRTTVKTTWDNPFAWLYTKSVPSYKVHYKRYRGHGNDVVLVFVGDVLAVEFKQSSRQGDRYAEITIEPPRAQLGEIGLVEKYSRQCTIEIYNRSSCGVSRALYVASGTLDSYSGNVLTSTTFGTQSDGYWNGGYIQIGDYRAKVIDHSSNDITIVPYLYDIKVGDSFGIYPGCDHLSTTCDTKFSNLANYRGQMNIPLKSIWDEEAMFA